MKYRGEREWFGYSRGYSIVIVEAESAEEAKGLMDDGEGEEYERVTVRDDTETCSTHSVRKVRV